MKPGTPRETRVSRSPHRAAMRLANVNAGLWALGNGLVSTQLVIYLANDLGAQGMAVGLILAAPRFAGVLRLAVPALIAKSRSRKAVCMLAYVASAILLCGVPLAAPAHEYLTPAAGLAILVGTWCAYHLLEYMGTVALWSWLGDLTPRRIRGRLIGRRERWLLVGRIGGIAASVGLALAWSHWLPDSPRWQPLRLSAILGAAMLLAAVVPLVWMPAVNQASSAVPRAPWRSLVAALVDPRYRRLLAFNCWLAFVQGLTGAAQALYPPRVLGLPYFTMQGWYGLMYAGQSALAPSMGRLVDRFGSRPVMIVSGLIAATGPLFFLLATPERSWLVGGAFVVWIAYIGLNVGHCWANVLLSEMSGDSYRTGWAAKRPYGIGENLLNPLADT